MHVKCTIEHGCIVILAAGKSNRLGSPKQLLSFKGRSLLQHAAEAAIGTRPEARHCNNRFQAPN